MIIPSIAPGYQLDLIITCQCIKKRMWHPGSVAGRSFLIADENLAK
jgi:hypothetical protein